MLQTIGKVYQTKINATCRFMTDDIFSKPTSDFLIKYPKYENGFIFYRSSIKNDKLDHWHLSVSKVGGDKITIIKNPEINKLEFWKIFELFQQIKPKLLEEINNDSKSYHHDDLNFHLPLSHIRNVFCVGHNYSAKCDEWNMENPKHPVIFSKTLNSLTSPYHEIHFNPSIQALDYEAELAVVIGKKGYRISEQDSLKHVLGYCAANDFSDRHMQIFGNGGQYFLGKSMDTFLPIGPGILMHEETFDPHNFIIQSRVNGELRQNSSISSMIFSVQEIISYISRFITLQFGDIIVTGSPAGSGHSHIPPKYLKPGDKVTATVIPIGSIINDITAIP